MWRELLGWVPVPLALPWLHLATRLRAGFGAPSSASPSPWDLSSGAASTSPGRETVTLPGRNFPAVSPPCSLTLPQLATSHCRLLRSRSWTPGCFLFFVSPLPPPPCVAAGAVLWREQVSGALSWGLVGTRMVVWDLVGLWFAQSKELGVVTMSCSWCQGRCGACSAGCAVSMSSPAAGCVWPHALPLWPGDVRVLPVMAPAPLLLPTSCPGSAGGAGAVPGQSESRAGPAHAGGEQAEPTGPLMLHPGPISPRGGCSPDPSGSLGAGAVAVGEPGQEPQ